MLDGTEDAKVNSHEVCSYQHALLLECKPIRIRNYIFFLIYKQETQKHRGAVPPLGKDSWQESSK